MMEKIKSKVQLFPQHIFRRGDELKLITALENIAAKNKVSQKINGSNIDKVNAPTINISLSISGKYSNVLNYLADIENMRYFISAPQAQMYSTVDPSSKTETTYMNLELALYAAN